ncbi:odorant receptor 22c-like [Anopheles maculipalpis]|uniref:odorant receptor 22c-like n=1 Tax=Anopheles maculipalpis TaxID=1496333 RepID=UPI0021594B8F|nr:odorant receptor 22c-like [Anopheles maculipalpis]
MVSTVVPVSNFGHGSQTAKRNWDIFKLQRKILLIFGLWPADRLVRRWYLKVLIAVNLITLAICIVGEFMYGLYAYKDGDLSETIESICPTVARISGFLRMVFYLVNETKLDHVLNCIGKVLKEEHPQEKSTNKKMATLGQQFTFYLFLMMFFAACLYGVTPFFIMAYNWFHGQRPLVKLLPFKLALPFDAQNSYYFALTTIFLNYASAPTITSQSGSDALFSGVCLYVYGQFQAIQLEMEALTATLDKTTLKGSSAETRRVNDELRRISKRHQEIIDLVAEVRTAFMPNVLLVYTATAIIMCIVCVAMLVVEGIYKLTYLPYAFAELTLLFLYSYSGTIIRDSSEAVQTVAYNFPWYRFDRNTRHLIQMMMIRAQYGSNVDVPFFETSMASFSAIVRTASSYITLMKSFL